MNRNPFLSAALTAAHRGWFVFPLVPGGKTPLIRSWVQRVTTDPRRVCRWWANGATSNVGVATGKSGLVVIDLDDGRGDTPPERFAGARNGRDALSMLAAAAGVEIPTDTYAVATPGGIHLYFRAPADLVLRNTVGSLGWKVDSRARGGYCVAAGSVRQQGVCRVTRHGAVAELPVGLARALTPPPLPEPGPSLELSRRRAGAYVRAIAESEAHAVATARPGIRHHSLLKAARSLGRLVGGGELAEIEARTALLDAASGHIGIEDCTADEVYRTIDDGIGYGRRLPRWVTRQEH